MTLTVCWKKQRKKEQKKNLKKEKLCAFFHYFFFLREKKMKNEKTEKNQICLNGLSVVPQLYSKLDLDKIKRDFYK